MSSLKPFTLYVHGRGPNPLKVQFVLEELNLPYKAIIIPNPKDESFLKINPNGRLPAIIDHNADDLTIWESGAILEYIVETYDKNNQLNATTTADKWHAKQYLHFQTSGQGPYYGQAVWFHVFHQEDVPSAKKRFEEQVHRVVQVLEEILKGKQYLLGDKLTYVDFAWVPWNSLVMSPDSPLKGPVYEKFEIEKNYPHFAAWHNRLMARESVKKIYAAVAAGTNGEEQ